MRLVEIVRYGAGTIVLFPTTKWLLESWAELALDESAPNGSGLLLELYCMHEMPQLCVQLTINTSAWIYTGINTVL